MKQLFGAIEAGGTKFVCAVGTSPKDLKEIRFATVTDMQKSLPSGLFSKIG